MGFDINGAGSGLGGGLFIAILSAIGFSGRVKRIEDDLKKTKDEILFKDTFEQFEKRMDEQLSQILKKLD